MKGFNQISSMISKLGGPIAANSEQISKLAGPLTGIMNILQKSVTTPEASDEVDKKQSCGITQMCFSGSSSKSKL